jgi:hypothetical protein
MSTCRGVILQLVFRHCASTVHVGKKFDTHNVVFESETCGTAEFLEGTKGETRQLDNSNSIGTNDDTGVVGIWLREMSDLGREGLWVSVLGAICELCFFVTQGFMNSKSWGMFGTMRQRNSRDVWLLQRDGRLHHGKQAMQDGIPGPRFFCVSTEKTMLDRVRLVRELGVTIRETFGRSHGRLMP